MRKPFGEMKNPFLEGFLNVFVSPFYLFTNLVDLWKGKRVWSSEHEVQSAPPRNFHAEAMKTTMARFTHMMQKIEKEHAHAPKKK